MKEMSFRLRFRPEEIPALAARFPAPSKLEQTIEQSLAPTFRKRGYLTRADLHHLCKWKSPRKADHAKANDAIYVEEITRIALAATNEQVKIEVLTLMAGVEWPVASVILHFAAPTAYPILDFRVLWSLSTDVPKQYDFPFWWEYVCHCRQTAKDNRVSIRTLDKALWQYSKENQSK
jgi:hypothetical protein